jgi:hypothetical protein
VNWKKGRGKLGIFNPLLGSWQATADSEMGPVKCQRKFSKELSGKYIRLDANWEYSSGKYDEIAMIGVNREKEICFWSFTSDGKQSEGKLADVSDIHPQAIGFEAQMPAGIGRMAYWPDEREGFHWVVEAKTKKGWNRFVQHHYLPVEDTQN